MFLTGQLENKIAQAKLMNRSSQDHKLQKSADTEIFDVIVIGAGIVGCAVTRRFTLEGAHVAIVEKASDILDGASKANSAILHTGFDAPPGSLELDCIRAGYQEYTEIHQGLGLPLEKTGAHVVAWNDEEVARFDSILEQAHENGIMDVKIIDKKELRTLEPGLSNHAQAAISVPSEAIIDPWSAPYGYLRQALQNGAEIFLSREVQSGAFDGELWQLQTSGGTLKSRHIVNCAGLYGDQVNEKLLGKSTFNITPRKGQFVVFDKAAHSLVNSVILPVPTQRTKGIVIFQTVFGNLAVGPTAEDQQSRTDTSTDTETLQNLIDAGIDKIPALEHMPITAVYAGLRPATEFKDYQIDFDSTRNWITVGGIRSTGLSGALGIARHVFKLYSGAGYKHKQVKNPQLPKGPVLIEASSQGLQRDWRASNHEEIVCHCELVTKREIGQALEGDLAARSLAGLKRQTRVTMGRCQGFYCAARLAELTDGCFETPLAKKINHG